MACEWLKGIADGMVAIGTLLGGGAAAIAVFYATRDDALAKWRAQGADDKRAEVAGQVLSAVLRFLEALRTISSAQTRGTSEDETRDDRAMLAQELLGRWEAAHEEMQRFYDAQDLAQTYLPGPAVELLDAVDAMRREMYANQMTWIQPGVFGSKGFEAVFKRALGPECGAKIDDLRARAKRVLGPVARREAPPPPSKAN